MKGAEAEDRAAAYVQGLGRELVRRNYRVKGGEIDLVSRDSAGVLYFTEVRHRTSAQFGSALESISERKYGLMWRAAQSYLMREVGTLDTDCRLEVLTLDGPLDTAKIQLMVLS